MCCDHIMDGFDSRTSAQIIYYRPRPDVVKSCRAIHMGEYAKRLNAADCKSVPSGSVVQIHLPPPLLLGCSQAARQQTLTLSLAGSIPATPTSLKRLLRIVEVFLFLHFLYNNIYIVNELKILRLHRNN